MQADLWKKVEELYRAALAQPPEKRAAFLEQACPDDSLLRGEVQSLLDQPADSFLENAPISALNELAQDAGTRTLDASSTGSPPIAPNEKRFFKDNELLMDRFRIIRFLGRGGMGEVYEADDLQLGRVALKTIRPEMAASRQHLLRFRQEVQLARRITDPHVCRIHDLFTLPASEGRPSASFLTMEFLPGMTLAQRIERDGPLPLPEAEAIALQLCSALQAVHDSDIIHRDFKSGNVMLIQRNGETHAVVMDLGLARETAPKGDGESGLTMTGAVMGTPDYMAPEQFRSETVPATDIYALGVVSYEMVTGRRPFNAATPLAAAVIRGRKPPRASSIRSGLPPQWDAVISRCLEYEPEARWASAREVATALIGHGASRNLLRGLRAFSRGAKDAGDSTTRAGGLRSRRALLYWGAGAVAVGTVTAWLWPELESWRHHLDERSAPPVFTPVTNQPGEQLFPTLSPDATHVAYSWEKDGNSHIYTQSVNGGPPVDITADCRSRDSEPSWSPDGQRIAYRCEKDGGGISIVAADGTWDRRLTSVGHQPSWSPDGKQLVVATERVADLSAGLTTLVSPLWIVSAQDGSAHTLPHANGFQPCWSPHSYRIAFWTIAEGRKCIRTAALGSGAISNVVSDVHVNWNPIWSADGRRIYFLSDRGGSMNLWRIQVDETSGEPNGDPEPVILPAAYVQHLSISHDGRSIAYVQRTLVANLFRIAFDGDSGRTGGATQLTFGSRFDSMPSVSGDGTIVAVTSDVNRPDQIIVMAAHGAGSLRQITDNADKEVRYMEPRWSPDGKRIAFQSNLPSGERRGVQQIWSLKPDGSDLTQLTHVKQDAVTPVWKPDGSELAYSVPGGHSWLLRIATLQAEELASAPNSMQFIAKSWSPDGRRIAGTLHRSDGASVGIFAYTLRDRRFEAITSFGAAPLWLGDGVHLLFRSGFSLYMADTRRHSSIQLTLPSTLHISDTFAVSSDNHWLIVSSQTEQANVWLARNIH